MKGALARRLPPIVAPRGAVVRVTVDRRGGAAAVPDCVATGC